MSDEDIKMQKKLDDLNMDIDKELAGLKEDIVDIINLTLINHPQYKRILRDFTKEINIDKWAIKLKSDINLAKNSTLSSLMYDFDSVRRK